MRLIRALLLTTALVAPSALKADPISIGIAAAASAFSTAAAGASVGAAGLIAGSSAGWAISGSLALSTIAGGISATAVAASAIVGGALAGLSQVLSGSPKVGTPPPNAAIRQPSPILPYVYGECRVGGYARIYTANEAPNFIGRSLETVWVLAADKINDVLEIYDGDELMWSKAGGLQPDYVRSNGNPKLSVEVRLGAPDDQTPTSLKDRLPDTLDTEKLAEFEEHVSGKPYVYITFWSVGVYWPKGLPSNMWFKVRGHEVLDPRDDTTGYSDNLVLCAADYVKRQGGVIGDYLIDSNLISGANLCDEPVTMLDGVTTQPRYTLNGAISTDSEPLSTLVGIMTHSAGHAVWTGDSLLLMPGAYSTPVTTFDLDDYRTPFRLRAETLVEDYLESVSGTFASSVNNYNETEYPEFIFADAGAGTPRNLNLNLPMVTNDERAQRVGLLSLRQTRRLKRASFSVPLNPANASLLAGQRITLLLATIGLSGVFEVVERKSVYDPDAPRVEIEAIEDNTSFWEWSADTATVAPVSIGSSLQNANIVQPPTNVAATASSQVELDGTTTRWITVTWTASPDPYFPEYVIRWTQGGVSYSDRTVETTYKITGALESLPVSITVSARNSLGAESDQVAASGVTPGGDATAPGVPPSGFITPVASGFRFRIGNPSDADLAGLRLYEGAASAAFGACVAILDVAATPGGQPTEFTRTGLPATTTRRYFVTAFDRSGNESLPYGPLEDETPSELTPEEIDAAVSAAVSTANAAAVDAAQAIADAAAVDSDLVDLEQIVTDIRSTYSGANLVRTSQVEGGSVGAWVVVPDGDVLAVQNLANPSAWGGFTKALRLTGPGSNANAVANEAPEIEGDFFGRTLRVSGWFSALAGDCSAQFGILRTDADATTGAQTAIMAAAGAGPVFASALIEITDHTRSITARLMSGAEGSAPDISATGLSIVDVTEARAVDAYFRQSVSTLAADGLAIAQEVTTQGAAIGDVEADIVTINTTKVDGPAAIAAINTEVSTGSAGDFATVSELATAQKDATGALTAYWGVEVGVGGSLSFVNMLTGTAIGSVVNIGGDVVNISGDAITLDGDTTVNGTFTLNGGLIVNGTVNTDELAANSVSDNKTLGSDVDVTGSSTAGEWTVAATYTFTGTKALLTATARLKQGVSNAASAAEGREFRLRRGGVTLWTFTEWSDVDGLVFPTRTLPLFILTTTPGQELTFEIRTLEGGGRPAILDSHSLSTLEFKR